MEKLKLKQVFTPGGQPSVTYVSRDHLQLETAVKEALARGYAIIVVTGPTKSGKTVLCNHVLAQQGVSVSIEGGQVRNEADFWNQLAHDLEIGGEAAIIYLRKQRLGTTWDATAIFSLNKFQLLFTRMSGRGRKGMILVRPSSIVCRATSSSVTFSRIKSLRDFRVPSSEIALCV